MESALSRNAAERIAQTRSDSRGWKERLFFSIETFIVRIRYLSEIFNQGFAKSMSILAGWHFIKRCGIEGDYLEFGVFRGETFRTSMIATKKIFNKNQPFSGRFLAFDSFEGLPKVASLHNEKNIFLEGEYSASVEVFFKTLGPLGKNQKIEIIKGWFNKTLNEKTLQDLKLTKAAFVNIDCDLYESTVDVLNFIYPIIRTGTVIYFDDWFCHKGAMDEGEALACYEWLSRHPDIKLVDYRNVGVYGKMFIVNRSISMN